MTTRKVTIEDISQKTGLSRGTVSRALNDRPDISQKTKQRVLEACRTLNYVPSHAARSLATGRNLAVQVLVEDLTDPSAAQIVRGVLSQAEAQHYGVYVLELGSGEQAEHRLRTLSGERIDAVLVGSPLSPGNAQLLRDAIGKRNVTSIAPLADDAGDIIGPDWREAGRLAARQLQQMGVSRTRVLARAEDAAFAEGAREIADGTVETIDPQDTEALRGCVDNCDAIATSCDRLATRLYPLAGSREIGRDLQLLGCGNGPSGALLTPGLSSIDLGWEEIGQRSMELVLQRLGGARKDGPQSVAVPPRLITRGSTVS